MKYGKYEIKNVKTADLYFSLDLYVDGQKFAAVSNDGRGGCHRTHAYPPFTWKDIERVEAEMAEDEFLVDSEFEKFDTAVDTLIGLRDAAKHIARSTKNKAVFILDGQLNSIGYKDKKLPADQNLLDTVTQRHPGALILNTMEPLAAAIEYVKLSRAEIEAEMTAAASPSLKV